MDSNIKITFPDGRVKEYIKGIKLKDIILDNKDKYKLDILIGKCDNKIVELDDSINENCTLTLYDINSSSGNKVYERGLTYLFVRSVKEVMGDDTNITIKHSLDRGIFSTIDKDLDLNTITKIKDKMFEIVNKDEPFIRVNASRIDAMNYFRQLGQYDIVRTLKNITNPVITMYKFGKLINYFTGELPGSSGILKHFKLTYIQNEGVVLRFPFPFDNGMILPYTHHTKYFESLKRYRNKGRVLNINNLGELNDKIANCSINDVILISEELQDNDLLNITNYIVLKKEVQIVLISGPSSSGKTTTSKKLSLYLKSFGYIPHYISTDDYFIDRESMPVDKNGKIDFESVNAIDVKLFNEHLNKLLNKEEVTLPIFNFISGKKEFKKTLRLETNGILIIEGLHALNEILTGDIKKENKFKIYMSPLTFLNTDYLNRISMTDLRLIRRMVRDNRSRGHNASKTLNSWKDVRRGEEKYVFPNIDEADVIFNSALIYELGVLKVYAEPLLYSVDETDDNYLEAVRLINLLRNVLPISSEKVPSNSILREFIGNSFFGD